MYNNKIIIILIATTTLFLNCLEVKAQNEDLQEDVSTTSNSLQGIDSRNVAEGLDQDKTPKLNVTLERDNKPESKFSTGNEFIDSLISNPAAPKTSTIEGLNTNKGDVPTTGSGTIPLFNF
jgi:hypothetical protein